MSDDLLARAFGYPYPVPSASNYLFENGRAGELADGFSPGERLPILAIGSNRSPEQLRRKYGDKHVIPVTEISLGDVDVGYCAFLTHYGSVPATLMHSPGTRARLKITWLNRGQLSMMHETESVGPHTFFGTLPIGSLTVGDQHFTHAYSYVSARGLYSLDNKARAVADIFAERRQFVAIHQRQMLDAVWQACGSDEFETWIRRMVDNPAEREATNQVMLARAVHALPTGFTSVPIETI